MENSQPEEDLRLHLRTNDRKRRRQRPAFDTTRYNCAIRLGRHFCTCFLTCYMGKKHSSPHEQQKILYQIPYCFSIVRQTILLTWISAHKPQPVLWVLSKTTRHCSIVPGNIATDTKSLAGATLAGTRGPGRTGANTPTCRLAEHLLSLCASMSISIGIINIASSIQRLQRTWAVAPQGSSVGRGSPFLKGTPTQGHLRGHQLTTMHIHCNYPLRSNEHFANLFMDLLAMVHR